MTAPIMAWLLISPIIIRSKSSFMNIGAFSKMSRETQRLCYIIAPPGWSHDGSRKTSLDARRRVLDKTPPVAAEWHLADPLCAFRIIDCAGRRRGGARGHKAAALGILLFSGAAALGVVRFGLDRDGSLIAALADVHRLAGTLGDSAGL